MSPEKKGAMDDEGLGWIDFPPGWGEYRAARERWLAGVAALTAAAPRRPGGAEVIELAGRRDDRVAPPVPPEAP